MRDAQGGERSAQRAVYDRYADTLFAVCRRYARNSAEAEDFAQDAWVRIFRKLSSFKFNGSLEGWLRRVTVSVVLRNLEKRKVLTTEMPHTLPSQYTVSPEAIAKLSADELLRYIDELPPGYRVVFNLFAVEGYSHKEIGELLGITASTSRSQLTKARRILQNRIASLIPVCL